jgi:hypothetical protein
MKTFSLQGAPVGTRILGAIRRAAEEDEIALDCRRTQFIAAVDLSDVTFAKKSGSPTMPRLTE